MNSEEKSTMDDRPDVETDPIEYETSSMSSVIRRDSMLMIRTWNNRGGPGGGT